MGTTWRMQPEEITSYVHEHIPLTAHLGARIDYWDGQALGISAPLQLNLNHRNTAFGGSLSAVAILSGWTLVFLKLREARIRNRLVIQRSTFDFEEPIAEDFRATGRLPDAAIWEKFLKTLKRHGRARISIVSTIECSEGTGGVHKGVFVAIGLLD